MITDAAIVGRGVGVEALAAIGCTDWTYWVVLWSVSAMTQRFATFIARYFGQQNHKMVNRSIAMSIILSLAIRNKRGDSVSRAHVKSLRE